MKRVIVGLSGGVDSSVAALILKTKGYEVIGIYLKNTFLDKNCDWEEESLTALMVSQKLGIPFYIIDITNYYKKIIYDHTINNYLKGKTPNPDILCNKKIKFNLFLKKSAILKADYIATGHYVRKKKISGRFNHAYKLLTALDHKKDQSYFLCCLNQYQIKKSLFPLGNIKKKQVRTIAKSAKLVNAKRKDSQGICFLGKQNFSSILKKTITKKIGTIILINPECNIYKNKIDKLSLKNKINILAELAEKIKYKPKDGNKIGFHEGVAFFTKGQRKGIQLGGFNHPLFVLDKDLKHNILYVGKGKKHPGLFKSVFFIKNKHITWLNKNYNKIIKEKKPFKIKAKIRSQQKLQRATLYCINNGIYICFKLPQRAMTEGQYIVLYFKNELIGSCLYD
ncbi:tRNA 2-thiouridine(34) synthase MnmA [Candidatus Karelsulcia muelleri]|uniref:tRNA 2-thiouridine(34) synthase MnmA n=1 Tax=Candidatus Karelsulcia muelleri TaxID=336810 RepID=UPI002363C9BB|nr:tRNA 2-thiouridine(34) synthase MnmA [Candidatus Karelsulcia muelleri]WDE42184.1 tRNA 2-thiouridine(34) synthase MnmA [Candidatus Karelsulcia muelleri]WDR79031.1 tRNA 2-thiouridine(34) synthase MnmA [Candidatus Karelsulcia muelleri]